MDANRDTTEGAEVPLTAVNLPRENLYYGAGGEHVNLGRIIKLFDTVSSIIDARTESTGGEAESGGRTSPAPGFAEQLETRLTNVVVAALKEAFNRDEVRLEMERSHLDEQRRRAEETMRMESRRQAADREVARLRLLAGSALAGWIFSIALLAARSSLSVLARAFLAGGCLLCLGSLCLAFVAQSKVGASAMQQDPPVKTSAAAVVSLSGLVAGLVLTTVSLLLA